MNGAIKDDNVSFTIGANEANGSCTNGTSIGLSTNGIHDVHTNDIQTNGVQLNGTSRHTNGIEIQPRERSSHISSGVDNDSSFHRSSPLVKSLLCKEWSRQAKVKKKNSEIYHGKA